MKIKREKINLIIILIYIILNTNSFFIISMPLIINFMLLLILLLVNRDKIIKKNKIFLFFLIMNCISLISVLFNDGGLGSFLNLLNFSLGILIFSQIKINEKDYNMIIILIFLIFFKMIFTSSNIWKQYLTGNTTINPNTVAMNILLSFCIIFSYLKNDRKKLIKAMSLVLIIPTMFAIYKCNSRTVLLALIIYILSTFTPVINKFIDKHLQMILSILIIIGILIPFIYVAMYQKGYNFIIPFSTKSLYTGRERLWGYMLESLSENKLNYIFGLGTNNITKIGIINNYHSWYLGILYVFGIIIYFIYFQYLFKIISQINKKEISYALISVFIIGFFETAGLWSNVQIYIYLILLFDRYNKKTNQR